MRRSISILEPVIRWAERLAARLGSLRSEPCGRALIELLDKHGAATITKRLDAVYGDWEVDAGLDPALAAMQWRSIPGERES